MEALIVLAAIPTVWLTIPMTELDMGIVFKLALNNIVNPIKSFYCEEQTETLNVSKSSGNKIL